LSNVKTIDVFLTTIFRVGLLPYLRLTTIGMRKNTLIEHKEATIICEESGLNGLSYNALLTTLEANIVVKPIVPIVIAKSTLTYTNCSKIDHLVDTYHNRKREVPIVQIATIKSIELITGINT